MTLRCECTIRVAVSTSRALPCGKCWYGEFRDASARLSESVSPAACTPTSWIAATVLARSRARGRREVVGSLSVHMEGMSCPRPSPPQVPSHHATLLGLGVYRPRRVVPNAEIVDLIDSSDEWIRTRSGITARAWAEQDETIVSMSVAGAGDALAAGIEVEQVDAVVLATSSQMVLGLSSAVVAS